jgi:ketosteroid isomerase-like protein
MRVGDEGIRRSGGRDSISVAGGESGLVRAARWFTARALPQENIEQIANAAYATLNRGDLEGFLALVDPEVEFRSLIAEAEGQTYHGHDGVRDWWEEVVQPLGGLRFHPEVIHDFGDRGFAELIVTGTVEGVDIPQRMWQAFLFRDGKPIWWATFRTEAEARAALEAAGSQE